jgi:SDR family mycofactocin-dependent oxidoreductase
MGKLDGRVAFITGVARGQGRSHAITLAAEGASIIGVDICEQIDTVLYPMSSFEDMEETVSLVEAVGGKIVARKADVRHRQQLADAFGEGIDAFGHCDIVLANAGVQAGVGVNEFDIDRTFRDSLDILLTGVWNTIRVTIPSMIERGAGGAIVITGSTASLVGMSDGSAGMDGYVAAKTGILGLMRSYANLLAKHSIRVNSVHPTGVNTKMVVNEHVETWLATSTEFSSQLQNPLPIELLEPIDISKAVLYLVSDDAKYVTGHQMVVDAGFSNKI